MLKLSKTGQIKTGAEVVLTDVRTGKEERHTVHSVRNEASIAEQVRINDGHVCFLSEHAIAGKSWAGNVTFSNVCN